MSIDTIAVIDYIGIDRKTDEVVLVITDYHDWEKAERDHILVLQDKINGYLSFVESGQVFESYPAAKGRKIAVLVIGKHPLSEEAQKFYEYMREFLREEHGMDLRFKLFGDDG